MNGSHGLDWQQRLAHNERLLREANWEVEQERVATAPPDDEIEFFCACGRPACGDKVVLTAAEYLAAHRHPHRFVVVPGHANPEIERVVERHPHYEVVEKRSRYRRADPHAG